MPIHDLIGHERDRAERQGLADFRRMSEVVGEMLGKRSGAVLGRHLHPVDFRKRAERHLAADEEVPEQARIGRRRRRHFDKEPVERLCLLRRREKIDVIALLDRPGLGRGEHVLVAHDQHELRPGRHDPAT